MSAITATQSARTAQGSMRLRLPARGGVPLSSVTALITGPPSAGCPVRVQTPGRRGPIRRAEGRLRGYCRGGRRGARTPAGVRARCGAVYVTRGARRRGKEPGRVVWAELQRGADRSQHLALRLAVRAVGERDPGALQEDRLASAGREVRGEGFQRLVELDGEGGAARLGGGVERGAVSDVGGEDLDDGGELVLGAVVEPGAAYGGRRRLQRGAGGGATGREDAERDDVDGVPEHRGEPGGGGVVERVGAEVGPAGGAFDDGAHGAAAQQWHAEHGEAATAGETAVVAVTTAAGAEELAVTDGVPDGADAADTQLYGALSQG